MSHRYDRVIWDFNGTILDDLMTGIESADELLLRYGLPPMKTVERYYEVFGFPIRDYYQRIGFDFSKTDYSILAHEWVEIYLCRVKEAPVRKDILDVICELKQLGIPQTVLSMTESSMLDEQLDYLGLRDTFDEVCGLDNIYATSKLALASRWREQHPKEAALFVGDTSHDAESAKVIGCDCVLLTGGHESREALLRVGVDVIDSPSEILSKYFA